MRVVLHPTLRRGPRGRYGQCAHCVGTTAERPGGCAHCAWAEVARWPRLAICQHFNRSRVQPVDSSRPAVRSMDPRSCSFATTANQPSSRGGFPPSRDVWKCTGSASRRGRRNVMRTVALVAAAACLVLTAPRHGENTVVSTEPTCWVSGDLVGDANPVDVQQVLCGSSAMSDQAPM